ncbi:hypothetical protein M514_10182 [Trichuris suis]|uniref:Uncharacterized protein n=1 Tax=Trichuris suis TaxID=68888 RepID=A0A085N993_9BILA|nr:hypothetical protein M514_10182 [Trichuris suis]
MTINNVVEMWNDVSNQCVHHKAAGQPKGVSELSSSHTAVRKNMCKMKERQILFYRYEETITASSFRKLKMHHVAPESHFEL